MLHANAARSNQVSARHSIFFSGGRGIFTMKTYTTTPVSFPMFVHPHVTQEMFNRFSEKSNIGKVY